MQAEPLAAQYYQVRAGIHECPGLVSVNGRRHDGVAGARRIFAQLPDSGLHGLAVNFNNLGEDGGTYLVGKLDQRRVEAEAAMAVTSSSNPNNDPASSSSDAADSDPDENTLASRRWLKNPNKWGVCLLDLTSTASTDAVLVAVAEYAVRDRWMRYLYAEDNRITLASGVDAFVTALNASLLADVWLTRNLLDPTASARLFAGLDAPNLRTLKLNACALGPTAVPALCNYLRSRRSQTLAALELNANALSREGVADILSALEVGNFSIGRIQLFANDPKRARFARDGGAGHFSDEEEEEEEEEDNGWDGDDPTTMAYLITRRAPALNERNMRLGKRVRSAAVKSLVPLRLIMHARSPEEDKPKPKPRGSFPLLDLPVEVQLLIARHASRDAYALTEAQWARILHYAGDRATLRQRADDGAPEWLAQMRCELWELENQRYWDRL